MVGFFIPGETAVVIGGVLAGLGRVDLELMIVVVVVCAIVGDSVGFEVGKVAGPWLLQRRPLRGNPRSGAPWACSSATGARRSSSAGSSPSPGRSSRAWPA